MKKSFNSKPLIISELHYLATRNIVIIIFVFSTGMFFNSCKPEPEPQPPTITLVFDQDMTSEGDTLSIGAPLKFKIITTGIDANITNFTVKKVFDGEEKTVMDSGLNSTGFTLNKTFFQGVEETVEWTFTVMDRNRNQATASITVIKDPNSQFGGIIEYPQITIGYQQNSSIGNFFLPSTGEIYFQDSATIFQSYVDVLAYFNYREDNAILLPSPTLSSPGEEVVANTELYTDYYPFLVNWTTRNYTKYDIRADNGASALDFENAHNDSLLIVSYDDVWGKKKYKWANTGLIIPFQNAAGKKGLLKIIDSDTTENGSITFAMKIQL